MNTRYEKEASPSWRAFGEMPWRIYDAVIIPDIGSRQPGYEVWTHGSQLFRDHSLAAAKARVEDIYGPLNWRTKSMPKDVIEHVFFGPTTEFTDPTVIHYVTLLPRLGE